MFFVDECLVGLGFGNFVVEIDGVIEVCECVVEIVCGDI